MTTPKAEHAVITLGDIQLDVYKKPDDEYFLSLKQVAESIGIPHQRLSEFRELKLSQTLYPEGFRTAEKCLVEGGTKPVSVISLDDVSKYWTLAAIQTQNAKAAVLLAACQAEALERRADAAFGIQRTEEARNLRLKGKITRRTLTDAIRDYTIRHNSSETYIKFIYANCSDHLNKIILGTTAKQAKEQLALPNHSLLRNHIPASALTELEFAEKMAARLIDERDIEPLEAVKQACARCFTKTIGLE